MADSYAGGNSSILISSDGEAPPSPPSVVDRHRGGWAASSFIIATVFGLSLTGGGWGANLIVFLIKEFNIKPIDAAQITNVVSGCINFLPLVGAVVADSGLGCFSVIWVSSLISLLGVVLLFLSVVVDELKPPACQSQAQALCPAPSTNQYAVLYSAIGLASPPCCALLSPVLGRGSCHSYLPNLQIITTEMEMMGLKKVTQTHQQTGSGAS